MLPQHEVSYLQELADVAVALITAEAALARSPVPKPSELGSLAWLAEFDSDDRAIALGRAPRRVGLGALRSRHSSAARGRHGMGYHSSGDAGPVAPSGLHHPPGFE